MTSKQLGLLYAAITTVCFSVLVIGLKVALLYSDSFTVVWFRKTLAFLILFVFFLIRKPSFLNILKKPPLMVIFAGLFLSVQFLGYMKGIELTSPSSAQVFIQLAPMFLVLHGLFYFKEPFSAFQFFGFFMALVGFVLFGKDQVDMAYTLTYTKGLIWLVSASFCWSLFAVLQKLLCQKGWQPQQINLMVYGIAGLVALPLGEPSQILIWPPVGWWLMIVLSLTTVVAYGCLGEALKRAPANSVGLITSLNPIITLFLMTYVVKAFSPSWLHPDKITPLGWLGAFMVVFGVSIAIFKKSSLPK